MSEDLNIVSDLAVILMTSGVCTILSKVLKQPLILGYIIAGVLVGPHVHLFSDAGITDAHSVHQWSEIGIIFLLFGLGLEFSFKKLVKVGSAAFITAGINCLGMFVIGLMTGTALGWDTMEAVFLGGMLSMSSTTIIIKAYTEMGLKEKPYAPLVFGILVVEDLIAVLLMVLLSTLAASSRFSGGEMAYAMVKLFFFLILWFLVGIYVIPTLLRKFKSYLTEEILLLVSIGLCFGMVTLASSLGFSSSLGAFVMGSILSETMEGERIARLTAPLKDLFGAVFFVSVGMMVDPSVIVNHWLPILIITLVVVIFMFLFSMIGASLSGKGLSTSTHTAMSLLQLGEFSFIIAGLGANLGVLREDIYPIIIAVSVITTFTTPYIIKAADPMERFLRAHLPKKLLARVDHEDVNQNAASKAEANQWRSLLKSYGLRILLYSVLLTAIGMTTYELFPPLIRSIFSSISDDFVGMIVAVVTLIIMIPFLYGLAISGSSIKRDAGRLMKESPAATWRILALMVLRILIALAFCVTVVLSNVKLSGAAILGVIILFLTIFLVLRVNFHKFASIEDRFFENLNQKEIQARKERPIASSVQRKLSAYDIRSQRVTVPQESVYAGKALRDIAIRTESGANIIKIIRGKCSILIPSADEVIYPGDVLLAIGTSEQLARISELMSATVEVDKEHQDEFSLECFILDDSSFLTGKTLREVRLRDAGCMVVAILRGEEMITNPSGDLRFASGDGVWIAGEKNSVAWFSGER
ncbi:MAG: cation:proton antiporter [Bacteroidales bacterium]|nr:cation:proton antiporter [Bacteroidales bacterium]